MTQAGRVLYTGATPPTADRILGAPKRFIVRHRDRVVTFVSDAAHGGYVYECPDCGRYQTLWAGDVPRPAYRVVIADDGAVTFDRPLLCERFGCSFYVAIAHGVAADIAATEGVA